VNNHQTRTTGRLSVTLKVGESLTIHDAEGVLAEIKLVLRETNGGMRLICAADQSVRFHRGTARQPLPIELTRLAEPLANEGPVRRSERRTG
jgi:hypothetical protein